MLNKLTFAVGNTKLNNNTVTLSLPAGHACKFAKICRASVDRKTGKIIDGKNSTVRCYAVTPEALFPTVRESRWKNFELLQQYKDNMWGMAALINNSIPRRYGRTKLVRPGQAGDFFSQKYFDAWMMVANFNPSLTFYAYTKALKFWVNRLNSIPKNFKLVASYGGIYDSLIKKHNLRSVRIVFSEEEAIQLGLELDHDDSHAWNYDKDFAILLHGQQKAGSQSAKIWKRITDAKKTSYHVDYFRKLSKVAMALVAKKDVPKKLNFLKKGALH